MDDLPKNRLSSTKNLNAKNHIKKFNFSKKFSNERNNNGIEIQPKKTKTLWHGQMAGILLKLIEFTFKVT